MRCCRRACSGWLEEVGVVGEGAAYQMVLSRHEGGVLGSVFTTMLQWGCSRTTTGLADLSRENLALGGINSFMQSQFKAAHHSSLG